MRRPKTSNPLPSAVLLARSTSTSSGFRSGAWSPSRSPSMHRSCQATLLVGTGPSGAKHGCVLSASARDPLPPNRTPANVCWAFLLSDGTSQAAGKHGLLARRKAGGSRTALMPQVAGHQLAALAKWGR